MSRMSRREVVQALMDAGRNAISKEVDRIIAIPEGYVTASEVLSAFLGLCRDAVKVSRATPSVNQAQVRLALQGMIFLTEPVGPIHNAEISPVPACGCVTTPGERELCSTHEPKGVYRP